MLVERDVNCSKAITILKYCVISQFVDAQIIESYEQTIPNCNTDTVTPPTPSDQGVKMTD